MLRETQNSHSLVGSKGTVLIGHNGATDWLMKMLMGESSCIVPVGWEKSQFYWLEYYSRSCFIRAGSDGKSTVPAGGSVQEAGGSVQAFP